MSQITTHVLDTALGKPAEGVPIKLSYESDSTWVELSAGITNNDGRISDLLDDDHVLSPGMYKARFETSAYFEITKSQGFYPYVEIVFEVRETEQHYHIPLLLSPYGYTTYRGS